MIGFGAILLDLVEVEGSEEANLGLSLRIEEVGPLALDVALADFAPYSCVQDDVDDVEV